MEDKKIENHDRKKYYKFFIVLLSLVFVLVFFMKKENQQIFVDLFNKKSASEIKISKAGSFKPNDVKDAACYRDTIVVHQADKIKGYDYSGKEVWSKDIVMKDYSLYFGDSNIYIYEKTAGYIQFISPEGQLLKEMNLDHGIRGLKKDFDNIIVYTTKNDQEKIYVIDKDTNVREVNDSGLKNILTYCVSKDYMSYGVSCLEMGDSDINSKFTAFKYGQEVFYRKDFKNEMVLFSKFLDTHRVVILTDKKLYLLNDFEGNTLWSKDYDLIKDIDVHNNKINILHGNNLETLSLKGDVDSKYSFREDYHKLVSMKDFSLVYGDNNLLAIKDGQEVFKEELKEDLVKIKPGKDRFIVIYEDLIDIYGLVD